MKIIRDGKEFELTKDELFQAYLEQEKIYDIDNIQMNLENYLDKDKYDELKDNEEFIIEAASELRRNQDKYNMDYEHALEDAISKTSKRYNGSVRRKINDNFERQNYSQNTNRAFTFVACNS